MKALRSRAKINLRLKITGRRAETGYHTLSMLNAECSLADDIVIHSINHGAVKFEEITFGDLIRADTRRELESVLRSEANLISGAAAAFAAAFNVPCGLHVSIRKNIPAGAGLGGGSSNAASILNFLREQYAESILKGLTCTEMNEKINKIAVSLGADVPFSLLGGAAIVSGIGEIIEPLDKKISKKLNGTELFIIAPHNQSSTVLAYKAFAASNSWLTSETREDREIDFIRQSSFDGEFYGNLSRIVQNDFQGLVCSRIPEVASIIELVSGLNIGKVVLSGSGSAILLLPFPQGKFSWEERSVIKSVLTHHSIKHFDGFLELS